MQNFIDIFAFFCYYMAMKRKIYNQLLAWKDSEDRKPLILQGARQIGKTYIVNVFAELEYENYIYINFETENKYDSIFEDLEPNNIIKKIEAYTKKQVISEKTLIVFDEIQSSKNALTSLKYFCEKRNDIHIIAMGSLLGIAVRRGDFSFPVGKVNMMTMYQMDFEEYLDALGERKLLDEIKIHFEENKKIDSLIHKKLLELYNSYLFVGGMPDVVNTYINTKNNELVKIKKNEILIGYKNDMTKYNDKTDIGKTILVYDSINECLAKENKKYMYTSIKKSARAKDYENATEWIELSGIAKKVKNLNHIKTPIEAYKNNDYFKFYMNDVGLLSQMMKVEYDEIQYSLSIEDFKGGLAENYVFSQLISKHDLYYYKDDSMEIDFIIKNENGIIPIEVKSSENVISKSLNKYIEKYKPAYAIRISTKNFGFENNIKSVPLYCAMFL